MPFVDVAWTDEFLTEVHRPLKDSIVVIADTFRATTVIPVALNAGAKKILVINDTEMARKLKKEDSNFILSGEKGGLMLPGFDTGNSPNILRKLLKDPKNQGRTLLLNTGNFSKVVEEVMDYKSPIIIASLVNRHAVAEHLEKRASKIKSIYFIATGTFHMDGKDYKNPLRTLEDLFGCLAILNSLVASKNIQLTLSKRAESYMREYSDVLRSDESLVKALWDTEYAKYLLKLDRGLGSSINEDDIKLCVEIDSCPIVPAVRKNNGFLECVIAND